MSPNRYIGDIISQARKRLMDHEASHYNGHTCFYFTFFVRIARLGPIGVAGLPKCALEMLLFPRTSQQRRYGAPNLIKEPIEIRRLVDEAIGSETKSVLAVLGR